MSILILSVKRYELEVFSNRYLSLEILKISSSFVGYAIITFPISTSSTSSDAMELEGAILNSPVANRLKFGS